MDYRIQRDESNRQIARMGCNARLTRAQNRMHPVLSVDSRATRSGLALVTRRARIAKITASGSLQQIPPNARHIANLRGSTLQQRFRDDWIVSGNGWAG